MRVPKIRLGLKARGQPVRLLNLVETEDKTQLLELEIRGLLHRAREVFLSQPMLLEIDGPIKICGKHMLRCVYRPIQVIPPDIYLAHLREYSWSVPRPASDL